MSNSVSVAEMSLAYSGNGRNVIVSKSNMDAVLNRVCHIVYSLFVFVVVLFAKMTIFFIRFCFRIFAITEYKLRLLVGPGFKTLAIKCSCKSHHNTKLNVFIHFSQTDKTTSIPQKQSSLYWL